VHKKGSVTAASLVLTMADIDDEPLFSLSDEDIAKLKADRIKLDYTVSVHVSEEVRRECEAEMERGRKSGWKRF
jgi:hypothetical protein